MVRRTGRTEDDAEWDEAERRYRAEHGGYSEAELAEALDNYTDPNHPEYDPAFDAKIRRLRPDWFESDDEGRGV